MWTDVVDLRDFYSSSLGRVARRMIRRRVRQFWPSTQGLSVLGLGFATPYLRPFVDEADRVVAAMPARQGVLHWPLDGPGLTALVDETELPFDDLSFDRVMLVHGMENAEQLRPMLREIWRILSGNGRLLVITPNRRGLWARFERTPFGHGRPFSRRQLSNELRDAMFTPMSSDSALYMPPLRSPLLQSAAPALENVGRRLFSRFGGVVVMEATKQIYAGSAAKETVRRPAFVAAPSSVHADGVNTEPHRRVSTVAPGENEPFL
ncbi:MAG: methyltransferase domain-containing protein [Rhodospirillales bacterium]